MHLSSSQPISRVRVHVQQRWLVTQNSLMGVPAFASHRPSPICTLLVPSHGAPQPVSPRSSSTAALPCYSPLCGSSPPSLVLSVVPNRAICGGQVKRQSVAMYLARSCLVSPRPACLTLHIRPLFCVPWPILFPARVRHIIPMCLTSRELASFSPSLLPPDKSNSSS